MLTQSLSFGAVIHVVEKLKDWKIDECEILSRHILFAVHEWREIDSFSLYVCLEGRCITITEAVRTELTMERVVHARYHICRGKFGRITTQKLRLILAAQVLHDRLRLW